MTRNVYVGAAEYMAGTPKPLEYGIKNSEVCTLLRSKPFGLNNFASHESDVLELILASVKKSLSSSKLEAHNIDAVFLVSNTLDATNSLDVSWLSKFNELTSLENAVHYNIGMAGCGGFHWAARLAASMIASNECGNVLIVSFDRGEPPLQRLYDGGSNFIYATGDAAASCILSGSPEEMDFTLIGKVVNVYDGKQIASPSPENELRTISKLFKDVYNYSDITPRQIDHFICNNYSLDVSRLYSQLANVNFSKTYIDNIAKYAHCFSSDNLINLHSLSASTQLISENRILLFSTGPFQWGACILQKL